MDSEAAEKSGLVSRGILANSCSKQMHNSYQVHSEKREEELLQLIGQYLCNKGYQSAYNELTKASGIKPEHDSATQLRQAILNGEWEDAEIALESLKKNLSDKKLIPEITFCILEQRFLELLESNDVMAAVALLRNRLTPLQVNRDRVHLLASCILCRTPTEIHAQAGGWSGANGDSRMLLVERIQHYMPAQTMLPPKRLEYIVNDAICSQIKNCVFHNQPIDVTLENASLLENHTCSIDLFPVVPIQQLRPSQSEVWFCQFSPNGHFLVTCGKENVIEVRTVNANTRTVSLHKSIATNAHQNYLCWAPDSSKFAVCFNDEQSVVIVFDPVTGNVICQQKVNDDDSFSSASFFADSRTLAFGGLKGTFYIMDTMDEGRILTMVEGYRVQSMTAVYRMHPIDPGVHLTFPGGSSSPGSAPGGPDAQPSQQLDAERQFFYAESLSQYDELLVADTMNRVSLFRFGYTNKPSNTPGIPPGDFPAATQSPLNLPILPWQPFGQSLERQPSDPRWRTPDVSGTPQSSSAVVPSQSTPAVASSDPSSRTLRNINSMLTMALSPTTAVPGPRAAELPGFTARQLRRMLDLSAGTTAPSLAPGNVVMASRGVGIPLEPSPFFIATETRFQTPGNTFILIPSSQSVSTAPEAAATQTTPATTTSVGATLVFPHSRGARSTTAVSTANVMTTTMGSFRSSSENGANPTGNVSSSGPGEPTTTSTYSAGTTLFVTPSAATTETSVPAPAETRNSYALREQLTLFRESNPVNCLVLNRSGRQVLVGSQKLGLQLWDIAAGAVVERFVGAKQENNKLHPTIGGVNDDFVVCGSENGQMHYWRCGMGAYPIHSVQAAGPSNPTSTVNCVHWNPILPDMLASVNDHGELFIWAPSKYASVSNGVGAPSKSNGEAGDTMDWVQSE